MKIAIQVSDLDHERIDGTRVYIANVLKYLGKIAPDDQFFLYHRGEFNPALAPPDFPNYHVIQLKAPYLWTQTAFALAIWRDKPDVLWMPMHNIPIFRPRKTRTVTTIHDLAFRRFPNTFPLRDLAELDFLTSIAINQADAVIAVSESTSEDILYFYPRIKSNKVKVVHHGFDAELFQKEISQEEKEKVNLKFQISNLKFILYVGAIQPRKNLVVLVEAFEQIADEYPGLKLVLAGAPAWMSRVTLDRINKSHVRGRIVLAGGISFFELAALYQGASIFVFPSKYEGFGIPLLESMASGTPVIAANNSSLLEVGGEAVKYFETESSIDLIRVIEEVLNDDKKRTEMVRKGRERIREFSWEQCAKETLQIFHSVLD